MKNTCDSLKRGIDMEQTIDSHKVLYDNLVFGLSSYVRSNNLKAMILGISGGLDSTIVASIAQDVSNKIGVPLIGLSLPCDTNKKDENDSANLVGKMCDEYHVINIQSLYEAQSHFFKGACSMDSNPIAEGNIKARIRYSILHHFASLYGGIVLDSDNLTEHYTGFFTIGGDVGEINPIGCFWKHELYDLAKWLRENKKEHSDAFQHAIDLTPTDGNGTSKSDLDQIAPGLTYNDVDEILACWIHISLEDKINILQDHVHHLKYDELRSKYGKELVDGVAWRNVKTEFKRKKLPLVINPLNGKIMD